MSRRLPVAFRALAIGFLAVIGAHALAFALLRILPDPAVIALGFQSADKSVFQAFQQASGSRGYGRIMLDLAKGDLGRTLDGVAVSTELADALHFTVPRIGVAFLGIVLVALIVAFLPWPHAPLLHGAFGLLTFLPPYVTPFIGLALAVLIGFPASPGVLGGKIWWVCTVSLMIPPAALAGLQAANVTSRNLAEPFTTTTRAAGASPLRVRVRLLRNLLVEVAPGLEKILTGLVAATLFAEPILGEPGLGTMAVRAVRRADVDLLLAVVLVFAVFINLARVAGVALRSSYRIPQQ